jgi:dolichol kinase
VTTSKPTSSASTSRKEEKSASVSLTAKTVKDDEVKGMKGNNRAVRLYNRLFHSKSQHASIAKKLKNRNHTNLRRKMMHCSFGLLFTSLNHLIPKSTFVPCMTALSSATLLMELLRYQPGFGWMNDALHWFLGSSLRKHEMEGKFTGSFYFFLGVTVTAALFDKPAACLGIAQLALADPSASYFGRQTRHIYWSRIENGLGGFGRNKGILGFLGGAVFCVPFNYRVLSLAKFGAANTVPVTRTELLAASFALGIAGAFADLAVPTPAVTLPKKILGVRVPPFHLDDNFVVPIVSGFAATKIFAAAGWPANLQLARFMIFP